MRAALAIAIWVATAAGVTRAQDLVEEPGVVKRGAAYTIDVHDADLARVLAAIGSREGFSVVDRRKTRPPLTVTLKDVPVDQALRRLLRGENYLVVYRASRRAPDAPDAIDQIALLSPAPATPSVAQYAPFSPAGLRSALAGLGARAVTAGAGAPTVDGALSAASDSTTAPELEPPREGD